MTRARFLRRLALAALIGLGGAGAGALPPTPAVAVEPDEMLDDPALEARAREISRKLRCLVCQNQSIDDSNAELARDLRVLVRERLVKGDTNQEAIDFIVARYGDFVLLEPPMKPKTWALWYGPAVVLALGLAGVAVYYRRRRRAAAASPAPLDDDERRRLDVLLEEEEEEEEKKG